MSMSNSRLVVQTMSDGNRCVPSPGSSMDDGSSREIREDPGLQLTGVGVACLVFCCAVASRVTPASAFENVETWEKMRVGGKLCLKSHEHFGESPPWLSKVGAQAYARRNWENFTTWEYGSRWGKLRIAAGKRMTCRNPSGRWICSIIARPCRK